jgi:hypothetical protein
VAEIGKGSALAFIGDHPDFQKQATTASDAVAQKLKVFGRQARDR